MTAIDNGVLGDGLKTIETRMKYRPCRSEERRVGKECRL